MVLKMVGALLLVIERLHHCGVPWAKMASALTFPGAEATPPDVPLAAGTRASAALMTFAIKGTVVATCFALGIALPTVRLAAVIWLYTVDGGLVGVPS